MNAGLVDRIYEAAFIPDRWPEVLQSLCGISDSASGGVFVFRDGPEPQFSATDLIRPAIERFTAAGGWRKSENVRTAIEVPPSCFFYDADYYSPGALQGDVIRRRAIEGLDIGGQIGTTIVLSSREHALFAFERWANNDRPSAANLAALNEVRPHLARASVMAIRLGLEQARNSVAVMERLGLPATVLSASGRVLAINRLAEQATGIFIPRMNDAIALATPQADALLQAAVSELSLNAHAAVRSIPLAPQGGSPATIVHVLPLRRAALDIFSGGNVLLAATQVSPGSRDIPIGLLMGLFDLTPAEARLGASLAAGVTLAVAASRQAIEVSTARAYLAQVFRKTGTARQSQLVALLRSTQPPADSVTRQDGVPPVI